MTVNVSVSFQKLDQLQITTASASVIETVFQNCTKDVMSIDNASCGVQPQHLLKVLFCLQPLVDKCQWKLCHTVWTCFISVLQNARAEDCTVIVNDCTEILLRVFCKISELQTPCDLHFGLLAKDLSAFFLGIFDKVLCDPEDTANAGRAQFLCADDIQESSVSRLWVFIRALLRISCLKIPVQSGPPITDSEYSFLCHFLINSARCAADTVTVINRYLHTKAKDKSRKFQQALANDAFFSEEMVNIVRSTLHCPDAILQMGLGEVLWRACGKSGTSKLLNSSSGFISEFQNIWPEGLTQFRAITPRLFDASFKSALSPWNATKNTYSLVTGLPCSIQAVNNVRTYFSSSVEGHAELNPFSFVFDKDIQGPTDEPVLIEIPFWACEPIIVAENYKCIEILVSPDVLVDISQNWTGIDLQHNIEDSQFSIKVQSTGEIIQRILAYFKSGIYIKHLILADNLKDNTYKTSVATSKNYFAAFISPTEFNPRNLDVFSIENGDGYSSFSADGVKRNLKTSIVSTKQCSSLDPSLLENDLSGCKSNCQDMMLRKRVSFASTKKAKTQNDKNCILTPTIIHQEFKSPEISIQSCLSSTVESIHTISNIDKCKTMMLCQASCLSKQQEFNREPSVDDATVSLVDKSTPLLDTTLLQGKIFSQACPPLKNKYNTRSETRSISHVSSTLTTNTIITQESSKTSDTDMTDMFQRNNAYVKRNQRIQMRGSRNSVSHKDVDIITKPDSMISIEPNQKEIPLNKHETSVIISDGLKTISHEYSNTGTILQTEQTSSSGLKRRSGRQKEKLTHPGLIDKKMSNPENSHHQNLSTLNNNAKNDVSQQTKDIFTALDTLQQHPLLKFRRTQNIENVYAKPENKEYVNNFSNLEKNYRDSVQQQQEPKKTNKLHAENRKKEKNIEQDTNCIETNELSTRRYPKRQRNQPSNYHCIYTFSPNSVLSDEYEVSMSSISSNSIYSLKPKPYEKDSNTNACPSLYHNVTTKNNTDLTGSISIMTPLPIKSKRLNGKTKELQKTDTIKEFEKKKNIEKTLSSVIGIADPAIGFNEYDTCQQQVNKNKRYVSNDRKKYDIKTSDTILTSSNTYNKKHKPLARITDNCNLLMSHQSNNKQLDDILTQVQGATPHPTTTFQEFMPKSKEPMHTHYRMRHRRDSADATTKDQTTRESADITPRAKRTRYSCNRTDQDKRLRTGRKLTNQHKTFLTLNRQLLTNNSLYNKQHCIHTGDRLSVSNSPINLSKKHTNGSIMTYEPLKSPLFGSPIDIENLPSCWTTSSKQYNSNTVNKKIKKKVKGQVLLSHPCGSIEQELTHNKLSENSLSTFVMLNKRLPSVSDRVNFLLHSAVPSEPLSTYCKRTRYQDGNYQKLRNKKKSTKYRLHTRRKRYHQCQKKKLISLIKPLESKKKVKSSQKKNATKLFHHSNGLIYSPINIPSPEDITKTKRSFQQAHSSIIDSNKQILTNILDLIENEDNSENTIAFILLEVLKFLKERKEKIKHSKQTIQQEREQLLKEAKQLQIHQEKKRKLIENEFLKELHQIEKDASTSLEELTKTVRVFLTDLKRNVHAIENLKVCKELQSFEELEKEERMDVKKFCAEIHKKLKLVERKLKSSAIHEHKADTEKSAELFHRISHELTHLSC